MIFCISWSVSFTQTDTLIFKNNNMIIGEIKSMNKGVLKIETEYSDDDFTIEWKEVTGIYTETQFMVSLASGKEYFGTLESLNDSIILIVMDDSLDLTSSVNGIVYLNSYKDRFLDRLSANIDVGFSLTKAQNFRQFSTRSGIAYQADKWSADISFNILRSTQDETDPIERTDGEFNFRYILGRSWYAIATVSLLSNTEQKLDLRWNTQLGLGNYIIRSNKSYWGAKYGVNRNIETYSNETADRNSWEGYFGTELNIYDLDDFSLLTMIIAYPGFTESGRWRVDASLDIKYDLPLDFYIKMGGSVNFDNHPVEGAGEFDYVMQIGLGWEW